jgi:hypothetical protein
MASRHASSILNAVTYVDVFRQHLVCQFVLLHKVKVGRAARNKGAEEEAGEPDGVARKASAKVIQTEYIEDIETEMVSRNKLTRL